jgi:hypothetical protein
MRPDSTVEPERSEDPNAEDPQPEAELDLVAAGEEPSPAAALSVLRNPHPDEDVG